VRDVAFDIRKGEITAMIGPSGCGKSTVLRCLQPDERSHRYRQVSPGSIELPRHRPVRARTSTPVEVRRRIGMVFQKPNPFPKSIYDNVAFGPSIGGFKGNDG
jgi:phosphate transport system ATP-binding protein